MVNLLSLTVTLLTSISFFVIDKYLADNKKLKKALNEAIHWNTNIFFKLNDKAIDDWGIKNGNKQIWIKI